MGFLYTVSGAGTDSAAVGDIFHITVAADVPILLHSFSISQTSDLGDVQEEVLRIGIYRGVTGGGDGVTHTPVSIHDRAPASTVTVAGKGASATSTGGSLIHTIEWNLRNAGVVWEPAEEDRPRISAANDPLSFRFIADPVDSISFTRALCFEEL